ncbi:MAG TPA: ABC transporter permease [Bryobacteraceae bacterium]|jgi:putative ABC transport system permease protein|nr:ABC transporter permease [Bryobacteraceae bacterium]
MEKLRAFWMRVRGTFRNWRTDQEFSAELESHLEMHIEDNVRSGMNREEARRQALLKLGGLEQVKLEYRDRQGLPWIDTLWQDIRFGSRMLRTNPGFTVVAVATLALGIGANTAIFSVVKAVLMAPLPYREAGRIVAVWTADPRRGRQPSASTPGDFAIWKQKSGVFEDLAPSYDNEQTLTGAGAPQLLIGYAVSANYLRILGVEPQVGRLYSDREDRPGGPKVALLSDRLWRTAFHSDPNILGKAITLDGKPYTVLGVMPRSFNYPATVQIWTPSAMDATSFDDFKHPFVRVLGRLKPGVNLAAAQRAVNELEARIAAAHPDTDAGNRVVLVPLRQQLDGDIRKPLLVLMYAAGLVLLIACANTAGLALARDAERRKEIAMRLALGATRLRLLRQFVVESVLLAAIGGAAGMLTALAGTRLLLMLFPNDVANLNIPKVTQIPMDRGVFLFAAATTLLTTLLFGIAPVLKAVRAESSDAMKDSGRGNTASRWLSRSRSVIVVMETALSLMLLTGAGLVVVSFQKVMDANLGFQPDQVLSIEVILPPDRYPYKDQNKRRFFVEDTVRRLSVVPGVKSAAATNFLPLSGFWGTTSFLIHGQPTPKAGQAPEADNRIITPDYLRTMGIPLVRGRTFTDNDRAAGAQVALINHTMAKQYFPGSDPVGQELNLGTADKPDWWRIVGVIGDVKAFGQDQPTHSDIYRPFSQQPFPLIAFVLRTEGDPAAMIKPAEQALWSVDPELPVFKAIPVDLLASQTLAVRRASSVLIAGFAVLALVLACIGIYGVMAYAVVRRTHEIGVRMALGAQPGNVLRMILGFGFRMTFAGVVIGLAGALASSRLLASLLFQVSAIDPLVFSFASVVLVGMAILAAFLPARRAMRIDPMRALRTE